MFQFVVNRALQAIPVLFLASIAVFLVLRLVPGDPADAIAGDEATVEQTQRIREQLGLTNSWPEQYWAWISRVFQGDLGTSLRNKASVVKLLKASIPPTLELATAAYLIALLVGIPLGVMAGVKPRSVWDWLLSFFTVATLGIPNFLLGILMLWGFAVALDWFPVAGRVAFVDDPLESMYRLVLPALALGLGIAAALARYTRTSIQEAMGHDYVRTARAKGLSDFRVVTRHALRNALIPVVTIAALQIGALLAGAIIIEAVFTRPGMGRTIVDAIQARDYVVVQGFLIVLVGIFVFVNMLADIAYGFLDPRIRLQ